MLIRVQQAAFDPGEMLNTFSQQAQGAGAVVSFTGMTRDIEGGLDHMQIEHYPGMTEAALAEFAQGAVDRWDLTNALIIHRFGVLKPGEVIMMVATAARHRAAAFQAADYLMDYLKSRAPFWKQEISATGSHWVESRAEDEDALARWQD